MKSDEVLGKKVRYNDEVGLVEQVSQGGLVCWATVCLQVSSEVAPRYARVPETEWLKFEILPED